MCPLRNSTFSTPASALFFLASLSISSVMSRPYALPPGETLRAESSTSMPPPLPRSSTTSPGQSVARAVGLPHPSDAAPAASGNPSSSSAEYPPPVQSTPSASESSPRSPADPQQEAVPIPSSTVSAAPAYLSLTLVRTSSPIKLSFQSTYLDQSMHQDMLICQGWEALCTEVRGRVQPVEKPLRALFCSRFRGRIRRFCSVFALFSGPPGPPTWPTPTFSTGWVILGT